MTPSSTTSYEDFVASKLRDDPASGFIPTELSEHLFPFQRDLVRWALRRGRAAIFADTGLGKSRMQLEWARRVANHAAGPVLVLAPLAVAAQTVREAAAIGVRAVHAREAADAGGAPIVVTNYERLHRFDPSRFAGVVLDESSCIKHHDSKTLSTLIGAFGATPFKLCATATPAPNDFVELGTHAEFLGACSRAEMLAEFFVHDGSSTQDWRLKGHARAHFWRWVSTWGALMRRPSDLGYDDAGYALPTLHVHKRLVVAVPGLEIKDDLTLTERRNLRRASMPARVAACVTAVTRCVCRRENSVEPTCELGSSETRGASRNTETGRKIVATGGGESGTQLINENEHGSLPRSKTGSAVTQISALLNGSVNSESPSMSIEAFLRARAEAARSAVAARTSTPCLGFTSTTVTVPTRCGASSAPLATSASESLATIPRDFDEPQIICNCDASERWLVWCELNAEQDALEEAFGDECVSIYGSLDPDEKERRLLDFVNGKGRILLGKPTIFGFGINLQMVARMAFIGVSDSFEQYYQAVRRCYRFRQEREVHVHLFASEAERAVLDNLERKEADARAMADALAQETREAVRSEVQRAARNHVAYAAGKPMGLPSFLRGRP